MAALDDSSLLSDHVLAQAFLFYILHLGLLLWPRQNGEACEAQACPGTKNFIQDVAELERLLGNLALGRRGDVVAGGLHIERIVATTGAHQLFLVG